MSEAMERPGTKFGPGNPLDVNWEVIKSAMCVTGMTFAEAEKSFGVSHWAIRKRAERFEWPLPEKISAMANELSKNRLTTLVSAESWAEKGEQHKGRIFAIASKALGDVEKAPPLVEGWADVERIDKMARRAAGLDNDETKVTNTFNFAMLGDEMDVNELEEKSVSPIPLEE